jgi:hypothetical protein
MSRWLKVILLAIECCVWFVGMVLIFRSHDPGRSTSLAVVLTIALGALFVYFMWFYPEPKRD